MKYISMFSGIEAATVAWEPLGWQPVAFSEIEPFPCAVLKHHYPTVPNLGDMTKVDWNDYHHTANIVVGGSPCQSFSIAGLRKALDDPRGQLMPAYFRACQQIDPEWIVWENVPGVLSADHGRAFGTLLQIVAELWPDGGAAWRVLDAQFYGVAQRRRRVFLVINTRDWRRAAPVLFERESLCWDYPSSKEKRKALAGSVVGGVAGADTGMGAGNCLNPFDGQLSRVYSADGPYPTLAGGTRATGGRNIGVLTDVTQPVRTSNTDSNGGHDPVAIAGNIIGRQPGNGGNGPGFERDGAMYTLTATDVHGVWCAGDSGTNMPCYRDMSPTLTAHDANSACFVNVPSTCIIRSGKEGGGKGALVQRDMSATLTTAQQQTLFTGGDDAFSVRRLTPRECERLQGFPDDYTNVAFNGKPASDANRYRALGNSMAVPVMRWIGEGINIVEQAKHEGTL